MMLWNAILVKSTKVQTDYYDHTERRRGCDKEEGNVISDFKSPMVTSKYNDYYRHYLASLQKALNALDALKDKDKK